MTAKEYLERFKELHKSVGSIELTVDVLTLQTVGVTQQYEPITFGGTVYKDGIPDAIGKIIEVRDEKAAIIKEHAEMLEYIERCLDKMQVEKQRRLIRNRYINLLTWEKTAEIMSLSVRWVIKLHKRAIKNFEKILNSSL